MVFNGRATIFELKINSSKDKEGHEEEEKIRRWELFKMMKLKMKMEENDMKKITNGFLIGSMGLLSAIALASQASAACPIGQAPAFPGADTCILDPLTIPKYVTPLVIPPVMDDAGTAAGGAATPNVYDISVRQFNQQILPAGFPSTTVWSYGPSADPTPAVAPDPTSQFNYPAYTIETNSMTTVDVRWVNDLVDGAGNFLPHLLPVDQTLHWANPPAVGCRDGSSRTDCATNNLVPYTGPVPIVTHVHGAHVAPHSDGYPEAWWLPAAANITPCTTPGVPAGCVFTEGTLFDDALGQPPSNSGYADYSYRNDQPATTLWYHDHSLGMTRLNVYAGPAGFWLIRGNYTAPDGTVVPDEVDNGTTAAVVNDGILPGPAPVAGQGVLPLNIPGDPVRNSIREIPIVIQDRSFNPDGSLFYPGDRAFFEGVNPEGGTPPTLQIPFVGDPMTSSDIAPIWNPEAFFTTMVVNGVTWPTMEVAPALYRLRLLNGCNSRFLNLALFEANGGKKKGNKDIKMELPFYQIGAEQGFTPQVVMVQTGEATPLPGNGTMPKRVKAPSKDQALLLALAERADVIVDFRGLPNGTVIRMINTAPDAPFGGFPDIPADPTTTGQVMQFVVNTTPAVLGGPLGASLTDPVLGDGVTPNPAAATDPFSLIPAAEGPLGISTVTRRVSLNEGESEEVCVTIAPDGSIVAISGVVFDPADPAIFLNDCTLAGGVPFAPKEALLGTVDTTNPAMPMGIPLKWTDRTNGGTDITVNLSNGGSTVINVTENPKLGDTEEWDIYNFTADAHPIHLHLVRFEVVSRTLMDGVTPSPNGSMQPWETGFKDTVIAYPGEITKVKAHFDIEGLYVWHCHIVEHEDNEMMRPYIVTN